MTYSNRLQRIDEIRGFTLISMIIYHFMWDLRYIADFNISWYGGTASNIWQKSICITFIFISGFCFSFGKKRLKRSLIIFMCGALISAVTFILMPENRVVFGVLTFLGSAGFITIIVDKLNKIIVSKINESTFNLTMLIGMLLLFISFFNVNFGYIIFPKKTLLPKYLYDGYFMTFIGFPDPSFFSTDYFAILPWIFLYLSGYFMQKTIGNKQAVVKYLLNDRFKFISYLGRNSLIIYMVHQPVLYLVTLIIMRIS
ncbi:MAG: heparan-alpha-glucosaminide N-acetyltransferase [Lachnospiraceae bacterium]|nr:heparan-alpha-glucosaminide N-acetyltransferase [Lachnospiraceae bacterium]